MLARVPGLKSLSSESQFLLIAVHFEDSTIARQDYEHPIFAPKATLLTHLGGFDSLC